MNFLMVSGIAILIPQLILLSVTSGPINPSRYGFPVIRPSTAPTHLQFLRCHDGVALLPWTQNSHWTRDSVSSGGLLSQTSFSCRAVWRPWRKGQMCRTCPWQVSPPPPVLPLSAKEHRLCLVTLVIMCWISQVDTMGTWLPSFFSTDWVKFVAEMIVKIRI